jgi:colanic acid biosynthesis glycosyl transferase WcaI
MKITFICSVFPPEPAPAGIMAHQLATRLVRDGHDVTMVVPIPNRPEGIAYPGYQKRWRSRTETSEGYTLVHCASWLIGKRRRAVNRILENITFGLMSAWEIWREGRPDVILMETWPLFAAQAVASVAGFWRVPCLYYIQDVYPEAVEEAGMLTPGGTLSRLCRAWDRRLCQQSRSVIVISDTMLNLLSENRQLPRSHFRIIPNWIDESKFPVWHGDDAWRGSQGIDENTFMAMFAGTLGNVSGVEVLVDVARILQGETDVLLLLIGEGGRKQAMVDESSRLALKNIRFLPFQASERVPEVQSSCDVALLTMRPDCLDSSVPSKLISYLAASRPVICAARSESAVARTVLDADAGLVVSPGDAQAIADAILRLKREPRKARQMGENARRYFEQHYTLERAYRQFSGLIRQVNTRAERSQRQTPGERIE